VIKSVSWSDFGNTEGNNSFYYLYSAALTGLYNTEGLHIANTTTATFEPGIIVRAGALNGFYSGKSGSNAYIQGYLVPAVAVPAPSSMEAREQFVASGRMAAPGRPQ
jgi:hypothetical protein